MNFKEILLYIYYHIKPSKVNLKRKLIEEIENFFRVDCTDEKGYFFYQKKSEKIFISLTDFLYKIEFREIWNGFANERIILKKLATTYEDFTAPVVICATKDDIVYLKNFLPYYRSLGVRHFVFIDNGFIDGSIEFLEKQNDVSLFVAPFKFTGRKKAGWKLQALSFLGFNHWYLWLDTDEFLAYPGMEQIGLMSTSQQTEHPVVA